MIRYLLLTFVYLIYLCLLLETQSTSDHHHHPHRLSFQLIHGDSVHSPYHNPKQTIKNGSVDAIRSPLDPYFVIFFIEILIGTPPTKVFLLMDTGSSLTWVKCQACSGQCPDPVFNYASSSSFSKLPCDSPVCNLEGGGCDGGATQCGFTITYADGSSATGFLAQETFTALENGSVPNMVFGCSSSDNDTIRGSSGVLGLGGAADSVVRRTGSKFSYCIEDISDLNYPYNVLFLGDGAIMEGAPTPMEVIDNFYYVSIQNIVIGDTQIVVGRGNSDFNTIVDSGTTLTYLVENVFTPLRQEIKNQLDGLVEAYDDSFDPNIICFNGDFADVKGFPVVTFYLADLVTISLDIVGIFRRRNDAICTTVSLSNYGKNVLGITSQQFHNVGYDLGAKKLYFRRTDCGRFQN